MNYLHEDLTKEIIRCAIEVHKHLGPGLFESAYETCLYYELTNAGFEVKRQYAIPLEYKEVKMDCGFVADLIVDDKVIVELKAVKKLDDIHMAQIMTYLKVTELRVGLLMNFNVKYLRDGIKRVIL